MVLNSLAEEKLQASLRCLARHGRFLEIGKYDLSNNSPLGQCTATALSMAAILSPTRCATAAELSDLRSYFPQEWLSS